MPKSDFSPEQWNDIITRGAEAYRTGIVKKRTYPVRLNRCSCCRDWIQNKTQVILIYPDGRTYGFFYILCRSCFEEIVSKYALILITTAREEYKKAMETLIKSVGGVKCGVTQQ